MSTDDRTYTIDDGQYFTEIQAPNMRAAVNSWVGDEDRYRAEEDAEVSGNPISEISWKIEIWRGTEEEPVDNTGRNLIVTPWPEDDDEPHIIDAWTGKELTPWAGYSTPVEEQLAE